MKNTTLDPAIKFGAGRYRQDTGILEICGEEILRFGKKAFIITGYHAWDAVKDRIVSGFQKVGLGYSLEFYNGYCTYEAALELAEKCHERGCDEIVGIGGGVIMDLAKAVAEYANLGLVNIPTSIATCAAFTTMSVMYTPEGKTKNNWRYEHEFDAVLVDMEVIAHCPAKYAAAGILDAMAKKIEIQNGKPYMNLEDNEIGLYTAYKMAENTYEILRQFGEQAIEDIKAGKITKTLYDVTYISIASTGILANMTRSYNQSALAHMIYYGVRTYFTKEAKQALHGEIVAVGLFTQLCYNQRVKDEEDLRAFMERLGLPLTLEDLGVKATDENLDTLEKYLIDSPYVEQTEEMLALLHEAMRKMR